MDCVRERNDRESWTTVHELIAQAVDAIHVMRMEAFVMAGVPRYKLPDPPRVPRPGDETKEAPVYSPREFARLTVVR